MRVVVVALVALAFAPAASAGLPSSCGLLTSAQVTKLLGSKVVETTPAGGNAIRMCTWKGASLARTDAPPTQRSLIVEVEPSTRSAFVKLAEKTANLVRLSGIGDLAYASNGALKAVYVLDHGYELTVVASLTGNPISTAKAAAKLAVGRL